MKTILAICVSLIFCSISRAETFGLGDADPPSQLASVVAVEPIADTFGLGVSYPAGEPVVYGQEVVSACPGGVCPLPQAANRKVVVTDPFMTRANTVTTQPVVVSRVTCPNCPVPTVATRAMPVAAVDCPSCPTAASSSVSTVVPPGHHAHRAFDGSIVVHHNSNFGDMAAHRGMSLTRIAEAGESIDGTGRVFGRVIRGWNGPIVRAFRNRSFGWRIRAFFGR